MKTYDYETRITWTGNKGEGTRRYESYGRDYEISHPDKPPLPASADPDFRGDPRRYSPEDLLVASLSGCHMLWYLHLCADAGIVVTAYEDRASGRMTVDGDGGRFKEAVLRPAVVVEPGSDLKAALHLHAESHRRCFIANSVTFAVRCEPTIEEASSASPASHVGKQDAAAPVRTEASE